MIRIYRIRERATLRLIVEGTLSGEWVGELEKCWLDAKAVLDDEQIRIDLSEVSYIDETGRRLLKSMFSDGAELHGTGVMSRGVIADIADNVD